MCIGATQAELHAPTQIGGGPIRPVGNGGEACIVKRPIDVGTAFDRMALVEMRMNVDERRPDLAMTDIDKRDGSGLRLA